MEHGPLGPARIAVNRIAEQGVAEAVFGMDPDLVRASGLGPEFDQGEPAALHQLAPVRDRVLALLRRDHSPALFGAGDLGQRQVDRAFLALDRTRDDPEVDLFHRARLERGVEAFERLGIARQQQADLANQQAGLQGAQLRLGGAGQLGSLAAQQQALRLGGAQAVMGAGGARQALEQQQMDAIRNVGLQRLGVVQSSLGAQPANLGMQSVTPQYSNPAAGALGGALAGAKLGSVIPGIGTGIGAGIGGLLGLLG